MSPESPEPDPLLNPAEAHQEVRRAHAGELAEDYVEAIAQFIDHRGECRVKDLAQRFGVTHVNVSKTVNRLVDDGLARTEPYRPIELTRKGQRLADSTRRRHETVLRFLLALGVSPATAQSDTEGIEHHISEETLERIEAFLDQYKP